MEVLVNQQRLQVEGRAAPEAATTAVSCVSLLPSGWKQLLDMELLEYPLLPAAAGQQITSWCKRRHKKRRKVEAASCEDPEVMQSTKLTAQLLSFKSLIRAKIICR